MINFLKIYQKVQWIVFSIALLIYGNTVPNKWTIDDGVIIHQNNFVKSGVSGIPQILSKDAFAGFYGQDVNAVAGGRYRPLSQVLFALEAEMMGSVTKDINQEIQKDKEGNKIYDLGEKTWFPNILHLFNAIWYALLCLVIYRTLLLLFNSKQEPDSPKSDFIALATTLIFTVHPLHTEVVANVKGLDEILSMLASMTTLYYVLRHYLHHSSTDAPMHKKYIILAVACYTLALFAKENAVTFIAVIPLALWVFTSANAKNIFRLVAPLFVPLILFLGVRSAVLDQPNKGIVAEELTNDPFLVLNSKAEYAPLVQGSDIKVLINPNANTFTQMPFSNQLATNFYTFGLYLKLQAAPYPLTSDYYPRHIEIKSFSDIPVLLSVLLHLFLLIWALSHIRKKSTVAFGILYYFITFSIVSNLFFPIGTNMAERFMFMPSLGYCLIIASGLYALGNRWRKLNALPLKKLYAGLTVVLAIYAILTVNRNFDWKDNYTLFSKDILVSKNSGKMNTGLAAEYITKAIAMKTEKEAEIEDWTTEDKKAALKENEHERISLTKKAIPLLKKALEIHPLSNVAWLQMAKAQHFLGQVEDLPPNVNLTYLYTALAAYDLAYHYRAVGMDTTINNFKAICLMDLGKLMGQKFGDNAAAISLLEKAKVANPENAEIYLLLGTVYSMLKDYDKTIENCLQSLALRPTDRDTKQNLAVAYQQYAFANASKRNLLPLAEKLLLEVYQEEKKLQDNDIIKKDAMIRTLDLIYRNYTIQGNTNKAAEYKREVLKLNPNAYSN